MLAIVLPTNVELTVSVEAVRATRPIVPLIVDVVAAIPVQTRGNVVALSDRMIKWRCYYLYKKWC